MYNGTLRFIILYFLNFSILFSAHVPRYFEYWEYCTFKCSQSDYFFFTYDIISGVSGALSLAELGTLIPLSGGEYVYSLEAFGSIVAFLYAWVSVTMLKPSGLAIICLTCADYINVLFFDDGCPLPYYVVRLSCAVVICE